VVFSPYVHIRSLPRCPDKPGAVDRLMGRDGWLDPRPLIGRPRPVPSSTEPTPPMG